MLAVTACGGGGGGGGGGSSPPTVAPTNSSYRPAASGDTFTYTGTLVQTFVRPPLTATPLPSPNPASSMTLQYAVTQNVSVAATAVPAGVASSARAYDFLTAESDVSSLESVTTATTTLLAYVPSGSTTDVQEISAAETTSNGVQYLTTYGSGNGIIDILPERGTGQIGTPNTAALVQTETDPDGQVTNRSVNADGSYTENITYPAGTSYPGGATSATASEAANGSGSYAFPLSGLNDDGGTVVTVPTPTGSTVDITVVYPPGFNGPNAITTQQALMLWYTNPPQLSYETYLDNGPTALPSGCSAASAVVAGRTTNQLVQTIATVDTIFGDNETYTRTSYTAPGLGVVCSVLSDVVRQYYDYTGQTSSPLTFSSTPLQTTTTSETLTLTAAGVLGVSGLARQSLAASPPSGYVSDASFRLLLERARARRHSSLLFSRKMEGL